MFVKTVFILFVVTFNLIKVRAAPPGGCSIDDCPMFDASLCKNGFHTPKGQCCQQCKGELKCRKIHKNAFGVCITTCSPEKSQCGTGEICCKNECGGYACESISRGNK